MAAPASVGALQPAVRRCQSARERPLEHAKRVVLRIRQADAQPTAWWAAALGVGEAKVTEEMPGHCCYAF